MLAGIHSEGTQAATEYVTKQANIGLWEFKST